MIGNLRINIGAGLIGFILTLVFSLQNNLWLTSLIRAGAAFAIWFALAYLLRWVFTVAGEPAKDSAQGREGNSDAADDQLGNRLDMVTPDEDEELMELIKPEPEQRQEGSGFVPLKPPKLVSTKDPEELAKAVRHLTEK
ncbi:hypothetical protein [Paenibacillus dakarensis]|uniref:hypothetical protein n=1 Tax=Paenibacillus dakarensis TaxID=1527293 RepID=UPI0006D56580|nr:hypothetical protein [Paenibacillus dakarensis]